MSDHSEPDQPRTTAARVTIPDDVDFSHLKLARDPITLEVQFDWAPITRICAASGIDEALFRDQHEDNVSGLIQAWYLAHLARGGAPDPVQEQLRAEVAAEDHAGPAGVISHGGSLQ